MDRKPDLSRLYSDLGYKPLKRAWAKVEIMFGLCAAGVGILLGDWAVSRQAGEVNWGLAVAGLVLFVLGSYLALACHRSHLYQSSNDLSSYLAKEIRRLQDKG